MIKLKKGDVVSCHFYYPKQFGVVKHGVFENNDGQQEEGLYIHWLDNELLIQEVRYWEQKGFIEILDNVWERVKNESISSV